jgi:hypothetical protein
LCLDSDGGKQGRHGGNAKGALDYFFSQHVDLLLGVGQYDV